MLDLRSTSLRLGLTLLLAAPAISGCGKNVPPPAEPPVARRSADEIILAAKLSPEAAPRAAFEIHRLDAYAACSAAQVKIEGRARVKAASASGPSVGLIGGAIVIGGLGLIGGITTTALAAGLEAPPFPSTPPPPNAELPDIEGKTPVIVVGVVTAVVVVGATILTLVLATGGDDDDDDDKKKKPLVGAPALGAPGSAGVLGSSGALGSAGALPGQVTGQAGAAVGGLTGGVGQLGGGLLQKSGVGVSGQVGVTGPGGVNVGGGGNVGGGAGLGSGGLGLGGAASVEPATTRSEIAARLRAFQTECPDDPAEGALLACIDKARILRLACSHN